MPVLVLSISAMHNIAPAEVLVLSEAEVLVLSEAEVLARRLLFGFNTGER